MKICNKKTLLKRQQNRHKKKQNGDARNWQTIKSVLKSRQAGNVMWMKFRPTKKFAGIVWKPHKAGREREQLHAIAQNHSTIILRNKSPHTNINLSVKYVKIYILHEMIPTL